MLNKCEDKYSPRYVVITCHVELADVPMGTLVCTFAFQCTMSRLACTVAQLSEKDVHTIDIR